MRNGGVSPRSYCMNKTDLEKEACAAYSDCNSFSKAERNLDWNSNCFVSVSDAIQIMELAVEHGYNAFEPSVLRYLSECISQEVGVCLAREGSVCVYIKVERKLSAANIKKLCERLGSDEFYKCDNAPGVSGHAYRVWWD